MTFTPYHDDHACHCASATPVAMRREDDAGLRIVPPILWLLHHDATTVEPPLTISTRPFEELYRMKT